VNTKKFTILHSNDMHGDFLSEVDAGDGDLIGGLALLSGYINKIRKEEKNVLYVIAGDMVQGSLIDSEYKGISTIEIMNYLSPDVVTLGNHELDYGLPHLLFLEKMANFPIVNANLYITNYNKRLMQPYKILNVDGFDILVTGIITDRVLDSLKSDNLISSFISISEAAEEVGKITNAYKNDDIDLTILLTHIGFESDKKLAAILDPEWGVDMIIGGHSHTVMDKPTEINNILITQAGTGTDFIGRFDIVVDDDTNSIVEYEWEMVEINDDVAEPDLQMQEFINSFKQDVDRKYNTIICKLAEEHTHPERAEETSLGNLITDAIHSCTDADVTLLGSGSVRGEKMGPLVSLRNFLEIFPYDDSISRYKITGSQLKQIFSHIMHPNNRTDEGECFQVNKAISAVYDNATQSLESLLIDEKPVIDDAPYTVCIQGYHFSNSDANLSISKEELLATGKNKVVTTSAKQVIEEYLRINQNASSPVSGRLIYKN
jgi:5'-nucleotidase/UDP-sugar diphosphatase